MMQDEFVVNKNSWHYRWLAYYYCMSEYTDFVNRVDNPSYIEYYEDEAFRPYEFCHYWRSVLLWPVVNIVISLAIIGTIIYTASYVTFSSLAIGIGVVGAVGLIFAVGVGTVILFNTVKNKAPNSFIMTIYKSHKNKLCPNLVYKKDIKS